MKTITNKFKFALVAVGMLAVGTVSAQTTPDPAVNIAKSANATPGTNNTSVRVIDNKGTIKYLQSNNGITSFTNTTANVTTTTFQLGGALTEDTFIDANGNIFALNGIATATNAAATSITSEGDGVAGAAETGFALLVREEATGETKKLLLSDLIESGHEVFNGNIGTNPILIATAIDINSSPAGLNFRNVSIYRNGAKLQANLDYTIADNGGGTLSQLTLVDRSAIANDPNDWTLYDNDIIEVHWEK
ncbi:hypothetical protein [Tenacibaculum retecalamus]|uniref:hypothetical protein n=1 Tax=Tenacibaculum retecalamus TaxID=3018315 RepID=UPI0023D9669E|nr:hypothetical protein [Tenacibaculum retecalamus]WBX70333.1 hypothetical protein PG912_08570 [Tenacibaculum retecalamus]